MSRRCDNSLPIISGIYKITSPSKKVYIGHSQDIHDRWQHYFTLHCKGQTRLYRSLVKYGVDRHLFEIIEECKFDDLIEKERHWQEHYDVIDKYKGLNCNYVSTKDKKSVKSDETIAKLSKALKGRIILPEWREKMSIARKGKTVSEKTKEHLRNNNGCNKFIEKLDLQGNFIEEYMSIAKACRENNMGNSSITHALSNINLTAGGFKWRYKEGYSKTSYYRVKPKEVCLYTKDGEFFKDFYSAREAAEFLNMERGSVVNIISGRKYHKIYIIEYKQINDIINDNTG